MAYPSNEILHSNKKEQIGATHDDTENVTNAIPGAGSRIQKSVYGIIPLIGSVRTGKGTLWRRCAE